MEPGDLHQLVQTAFNSKDVDALVARTNRTLGCSAQTDPFKAMTRSETWAGFVAWTHSSSWSRSTAYCRTRTHASNRWTARIGDDKMSAVTAEVARRQPDGTWRYLIDNPDGAATGVLAAEA